MFIIFTVICAAVNLQLHLCNADTLLPLDAVMLDNLKVDIEGLVGVDVLIQTAKANHTAPCNHLEVVVLSSGGDVTNFSINATEQVNKELVSYEVNGLDQDVKYGLYLQASNTIISHNYTLVTTGLQSVTVIPRAFDTEVVCEFLPNSKADGCLIEWRPEIQDNSEEFELTMLSRRDGDSVSVNLQTLPGTLYQIYAFGLQGNNKLHMFPITPKEEVITMPIELSEAPTSRNEPDEPLSFMVLVTILSVVLASILIGIIILICVIVAIVKCPKKSHRTMPKDMEGRIPDENIQTMANICYEGLLEEQRRRHQVDDENSHVYDDIAILKTSTDQDYENVDPSTGFPIVPKMHFAQQDCSDCCERACLPLKGTKPVSTSQLILSRTHTFKHKQSDSRQGLVKTGAVSVILKAADYEVPTRDSETMPR